MRFRYTFITTFGAVIYIAVVVFFQLEVFEVLREWLEKYETHELDEFVLPLIIMAFAALTDVFVWREGHSFRKQRRRMLVELAEKCEAIAIKLNHHMEGAERIALASEIKNLPHDIKILHEDEAPSVKTYMEASQASSSSNNE